MIDSARTTLPVPPASRRRPRFGLVSAASLAFGLIAIGCDSPQSRPGIAGPGPNGVDRTTIEPTGIPPETIVDARPAAFVEGLAVPWGRLRDALTERAGAEVLRELVLDRRLDRALVDAGITLGQADIRTEEEMLLRSLSDDPDEAARLLEALRDRRGLGELRFREMLRRTAGLRALVAPTIRIAPEQRAAMHDVLHGPKRRVRLITTPDLAAAADARRAVVENGERFADVAAARSTDLSAARGGLLDAFAARDLAYPASLRDAAFDLENPGDVSPPLLLAEGAAIIQLVEAIEGDGTTRDASAETVERLVRRTAERAAMDRLARSLVNGATVTILDPTLGDAWRRARRASRQNG